MDLNNLEKILKTESKYRLKQAKSAVFQELINDWMETSSLPLELRKKLNETCAISIKGETLASKTKDTIKSLITLKDGLKIETVLMRHKPRSRASSLRGRDKRNTICVSSQVGCPLGCSFCATGKIGFKRNLEVWEIIEQVLFFARYLKKDKKKVTNIVFMGMGEPFLNYQNVMAAIKTLNDKEGFNLGARHFSISTIGIVEGIEKLAEEKLQINLAVSLHAPNDELRFKLMPINKKYPIGKILKAADDYIKKTRRRVMFEYIMIKNLNDSEENAKKLAKLMKKPLYFVNLISYNFTRRSLGEGGPTGIFESSLPSKIKRFKEILEKEGVAVTQRYSFGQDIEGACGQLATRKIG